MRIEVVKDFARCSVFHHFRHEAEAKVPKAIGTRERFETAMGQVASYLWHQVQNGQYPTQHLVKKAWGRIWAPGRTREELLFYVSSWRDEQKKLEKRGLRYALALREHFNGDPGCPVLIDRAYDVPFGKGRSLQGRIDLVREVEGVVELIMYSVSDKPLSHFVRNDVSLTGAAWATKKILGRAPDRLVLFHLPTCEEHFTTRTEDDYKALHRMVRTIENAIADKQRIPALNTNCIGCPYLTPCERKEWL